jgi:hypothetical protein
MKKCFFLILIAAGLTSGLFAQSKDSAALPVKSGNEWQMPGDVIRRSRSFATNCQKLSGLDSTATQKLFELYMNNTKSVDEIRIGGGSDRDKKAAMDANQQQFDERVRGLLTAGQYARYLRERRAGKLP